uniref:Uncharacterized protein n=1 Tax=Oryza brachyantha TaxID=4533 RepID=J3LXI9_ORYBR
MALQHAGTEITRASGDAYIHHSLTPSARFHLSQIHSKLFLGGDDYRADTKIVV